MYLEDYLQDLDRNTIDDILDVDIDLTHFEEGEWDLLANRKCT